jgi:hypothetical protein
MGRHASDTASGGSDPGPPNNSEILHPLASTAIPDEQQYPMNHSVALGLVAETAVA